MSKMVNARYQGQNWSLKSTLWYLNSIKYFKMYSILGNRQKQDIL